MKNFITSFSVYFNNKGEIVFSNLAMSGEKFEVNKSEELRKKIVTLVKEFNKKENKK